MCRIAYFKGPEFGYDSLIPPYVVMPKPQGRFADAYDLILGEESEIFDLSQETNELRNRLVLFAGPSWGGNGVEAYSDEMVV